MKIPVPFNSAFPFYQIVAKVPGWPDAVRTVDYTFPHVTISLPEGVNEEDVTVQGSPLEANGKIPPEFQLDVLQAGRVKPKSKPEPPKPEPPKPEPPKPEPPKPEPPKPEPPKPEPPKPEPAVARGNEPVSVEALVPPAALQPKRGPGPRIEPKRLNET